MKYENTGEIMNQQISEVTVNEIIIAGRLALGRGGIKSSLETEEDIQAYSEKVRRFLVVADEPNTAVCIDGRASRCLASQLTEDGSFPTEAKSPIRPKMEGGLVNAMTDAAILACWSALTIEERSNFMKARSKVAAFLEEQDFFDSAHTADTVLGSDKTTECGAWMAKQAAFTNFAKSHSKDVVAAVAAYNGADSVEANDLLSIAIDVAKDNISQSAKDSDQFFAGYNPVELRNTMKETSPANLEVLFSDADHPTHNHKEPALIIVDSEDPTITIDRDAMYEQDGFAPFVDNRNLRRHLANLMGGSDLEKQRLLVSGDLITAMISDELVAAGMPVIVIR